MSEPIHIISLGAGVQSSVMLLMAMLGLLLPMPIAAIFADTQAEPKSVYLWLHFLCGVTVKYKPDGTAYVDTGIYRGGLVGHIIPVHIITAGSLMDHSTTLRFSKKTPGNVYIRGAIPAFVENPDGSKGLLGRKCTADFKIRPLVKYTRTLCDWHRGEKRLLVIKWIGISSDEIWRMKESREKWIRHRHPLVDVGMTREDCLSWMKERGYPEPPRSACSFCPFHSDEEWERLKRTEPEAFLQAVDYENRLQLAASKQNVLKGKPWLHSSMKAIGLVDFTARKPSHQQLNMFNNECEGMCGV